MLSLPLRLRLANSILPTRSTTRLRRDIVICKESGPNLFNFGEKFRFIVGPRAVGLLTLI